MGLAATALGLAAWASCWPRRMLGFVARTINDLYVTLTIRERGDPAAEPGPRGRPRAGRHAPGHARPGVRGHRHGTARGARIARSSSGARAGRRPRLALLGLGLLLAVAGALLLPARAPIARRLRRALRRPARRRAAHAAGHHRPHDAGPRAHGLALRPSRADGGGLGDRRAQPHRGGPRRPDDRGGGDGGGRGDDRELPADGGPLARLDPAVRRVRLAAQPRRQPAGRHPRSGPRSRGWRPFPAWRGSTPIAPCAWNRRRGPLSLVALDVDGRVLRGFSFVRGDAASVAPAFDGGRGDRLRAAGLPSPPRRGRAPPPAHRSRRARASRWSASCATTAPPRARP